MIINSVKLKNFGCINHFERKFGRGIFVLSGENGNGKSTVFKAVVLALFDSYEGSLGDYVNWDADEFSVDIDFEHTGKNYSVSVKYNGKATDRQVTDKSTGDVYAGQEAKDFLKKLFDQELIKAAMLSLEQQIDVVTVKPADRREYLKRIYDLEFKRQRQEMADALIVIGGDVSALNGRLGVLREKKYEFADVPELPMSSVEFLSSERAYASNSELIGKLKAERRRYEEAVKKISDLAAEIESCDGKIADCENQIVGKRKALEALPVESKKRSVLLETEINSGEMELKLIEANKNTELAEKDRAIAEIQVLRVPAFDQEARNRLKADLRMAESKIRELSDVKDICPVCGQKLPQDEAAVEKRKADLETYKKQAAELSAKAKELDDEYERVEKMALANQENKEKKAKLVKERELAEQRHDSHCREVKSSIESKKILLANEAQTLERLQRVSASELEAFEKNRREITDRRGKAAEELAEAKTAALSDPAGELANIENTNKVMKAVIDKYLEARTEQEAAVRHNRALEEQTLKDAAEIKKLDDELREKSREAAELEKSVKILTNEFPVYVISKIVKDLENSMNDFLRKTYGGRYKIRLEDKKNALRMVYGPKSMDAGMASGYEKSIFSLAWKWALSKVQNNRTMLMDEVDSAASQKNSTLFYQTVGDSLKLFDQILVVSHKEQTRELLENEFGAEVLTFVNGAAA